MALVILIPFWMWLAWLLTPKTKLVAAIVDKTVLTNDGQEHISFTWILNHQRYTKTSTKPYRISEDYYGFFPMDQEQFRLKGLERFSSEQLVKLSNDADLVYLTDTYGIYRNEWSKQGSNTERSGLIYGGMSQQDIDFLRLMKAKKKLIISEFNVIGSPTPMPVRNDFEKLFSLRWTGWTGRYFENLDTTKNTELPRWLISNYKRDNNNQWPFSKSGIAFVSDNDRVVILEDSTHLSNAVPHIVSSQEGQERFGLPERIKYTFWFDVIVPDPKINKQLARFDISANSSGRALLNKHNIPLHFPAVLTHDQSDYKFYYFSGDFCDNNVSMTSSYLKGIAFFKWLFYNSDNTMERSSFFWNFYRPMMTKILKEERTHTKE